VSFVRPVFNARGTWTGRFSAGRRQTHPKFKMRPFSYRSRQVIKRHVDRWEAWRASPNNQANAEHLIFLVDACTPLALKARGMGRAARLARDEISDRLSELQQMSAVELMTLLIEF